LTNDDWGTTSAAMPEIDIFFLQENAFAIASAICALVAVGAAYADRRRSKRRDIDKVGFMPWTSITVLAGICCFGFLLYAIALG